MYINPKLCCWTSQRSDGTHHDGNCPAHVPSVIPQPTSAVDAEIDMLVAQSVRRF